MATINPRLIAEALALPQVAEQLAAAPLCAGAHVCMDHIRIGRRRSAELEAAWDTFYRSLSAQQQARYCEFEAAETAYWCDARDRFVEELARHLPGLAPVLRALAYHHLYGQHDDKLGVCCEAAS